MHNRLLALHFQTLGNSVFRKSHGVIYFFSLLEYVVQYLKYIGIWKGPESVPQIYRN